METYHKCHIEYNPVTLADYTNQKTMDDALKTYLPQFEMIGEEDPSDYMHLDATMSPDDIITDLIPEELLASRIAERADLIPEHLRDEIDQDPLTVSPLNAGIYVDPLDGTKDFVAGRVQNVTCLVGVAINERSKIGVVHKPYAEGPDCKTGVTYFGSLETGLFRAHWDPTWTEEEKRERNFEYIEPLEHKELGDDENFNVIVTASKLDDKAHKVIDSFEPCTYSQLAGAGNKMTNVYMGK